MTTGERRTLRLAHRGDHGTHPENTIAALVAAMADPACDGVEFDVHLSRDGVPVVIHDATLDRVQGVLAAVADLTAAELERHDVPTLEAAIAAVPRRAFLDVELKVPIGRALIEVLAAGRGPDLSGAIVSSFEEDALRRVHGLTPTWPIWLNAADLAPATIRRALDLGCAGIAVQWRAIDERSTRRVRDAGLGLTAWTVTRRPTYDRLAGLGIDAVCVEGPALRG
ncbi:MAG: glycerophosphodiester phosphodiesterase [Candidatus Limnocylindrales bacterium]